MVALDIFKKPLQEAALAKADIAPLDFDKIAGHVDKEDMNQAVELIQAVFKGGNFDMRLVSYYLYAHFLKIGVMSFKETLPIFKRLVSDHWELLRPFQRKERQIENSFNWYFTHIINKLKYNERLYKQKKELLWAFSSMHVTQNDFEELQDTLKSFMSFFHDRWATSPVKERVGNLIKQINDLKPFILKEQEIESGVEEEQVDEETQELSPPDEKGEKIEKTLPEPNPFETPAMNSLVKKLATFEQLIEKQEFLKAAVVVADITQAISNFDPSVYFPKIFSSYFNMLARHSSSIAEEMNNQETFQWKSLDGLYKADIDRFIEW